MNEQLTRDIMITTGMCDSAARLSPEGAFELCMDIATQHAADLGMGVGFLMRRQLFWLAVRTKIRFLCRPSMEDTVTLSTWPERPRRLRCNRSYRLTRGGEVMFEGRTEWAILNTQTSALLPGEEIFPDDFSYPDGVFDAPFARVRDNFDGIESYAFYTVRSTDIDLGGHMNNAAYIRALMGTFSTSQLSAMELQELDVRYVSPSYEGERLSFQRRDTDTGYEIRVSAGDRTVLLIAMRIG